MYTRQRPGIATGDAVPLAGGPVVESSETAQSSQPDATTCRFPPLAAAGGSAAAAVGELRRRGQRKGGCVREGVALGGGVRCRQPDA